MGTHGFVLTSQLIYWALFLDENYFLTTYGAFFKKPFGKNGTSDYLFSAVAQPNFGNLIFQERSPQFIF